MTAKTILETIQARGDARLQPNVAYLSFHNDSWLLMIENYLWLRDMMQKVEVIDWLSELAPSEGAKDFRVNPPAWKPSIAGGRISCGMKAPALEIPLPGGLAMLEQYEAMLSEAAASLTIYGSFQGPTHRRVMFSDWLPEEWHAHHRRLMGLWGMVPSYYGWLMPSHGKTETGSA